MHLRMGSRYYKEIVRQKPPSKRNTVNVFEDGQFFSTKAPNNNCVLVKLVSYSPIAIPWWHNGIAIFHVSINIMIC